jgi:hypothetical protein
MNTESYRLPGVKSIVDKLSRFKTDPDQLDLEGISDSIEALFLEIGSEDPGNIIADAVSCGTLTQAQGNKILEVAMWSGQTNGKELNVTLEKWLEEGTDPIKIELALAPSVFPFSTQEKMANVLTSIAQRFPHLAPPIHEIIKRREAQGV